MSDETRLSTLETLRTKLQRQLEDTNKAIYEEQIRLVKEKFGVTIGSIVTYRGKEYQVAVVECFWANKPWISGRPKRKNGTFGVGIKNLFGDWESQP